MNGEGRWLRACTWAYLSMLSLTLISFAIGTEGSGGNHVSLLVLTLALIKGQLVGDFFMGLKGIRGPWRWVIALWLVVPGGLITAAFVLSG